MGGHMIDYRLISRSIEYYAQLGYIQVETPWVAPVGISAITAPPGAVEMEVTSGRGVLVASGEQAFLFQYLRGYLPKGKF